MMRRDSPEMATNTPHRAKVRYHSDDTSYNQPAKGGPRRLATPWNARRRPYAELNCWMETRSTRMGEVRL